MKTYVVRGGYKIYEQYEISVVCMSQVLSPKIKKLLLKLVDVIEHLLLRLMGWK